ncbi:MAG: membrane protein insertase YidC, partial [Limisphaerales bacterium]
NNAFACFFPRPRDTFITGKGVGSPNGIHWSAVVNQFFAVVTMPKEPAPMLTATRRAQNYTNHFAGEKFEEIGYRYSIDSSFSYSTNQLIPGLRPAVVHNYQIYVGPKEYKTFEKLSLDMKNDVDAVMDFNPPFGFFARALLRSMNGLHSWGLTYAGAIIAITVIIKLLFWPLTNASTKSMKRMSALQPQMKEIQAKYKDNPQKMNQKMMEFMKENKVNPLGGCLPMLLQLPVFFGFFTMLRSAVELRGESFLWVCDLSAPDTIAHIGGFPVNPLPILMAVTMFWQSSLTPPSPGMDPAQQKILKFMPMMFVFILYNFSSALTLYWTVQNVLTIIQTKLTKISDAKKEAKQVTGPMPSTGGKGGGKKKGKKNRPNNI